MKFEDAIAKSIKNFMQGKVPPATSDEAEGGLFYTPEYFDQLEEALLGTPAKDKDDVDG